MKLAKLNTKLFKVNLKDNDYELVTYRQLSLWVTRRTKAAIVKAIRQGQASMFNVDVNQVSNVQWSGF